LIGQELEVVATSFGRGKILKVGVVEIVLELENSRMFVVVENGYNTVPP
jgi:hypothetical protein